MKSKRISLMLVGVACGLALAGCGGSKSESGSGAVSGGARPVVTAIPGGSGATVASATAVAVEPKLPQPKEGSELVRLAVPAAKIDAPIQVKGVNGRNEMENPDGKDNVAWYDFSEFPGFGSNAVFSGHVDWFTGETAVFWGLRNLKGGEEIVLKLSDGMQLTYKVVDNKIYKTDAAPVAEIVGPSTKDIITLITCDGVFDSSSQEYNNRRVVRAERVN